jgi:uncharacterized protein
MQRVLFTVGLLIASNAFMTTAWYYHIKQKDHWPLLMAIGISWMIALPEYCLQVPANRLGHVSAGGPFTLPQLKILQEAITLLVFTAFTVLVMHERPRTNDLLAFMLMLAAVAVAFWGKR